MSIETAIAVFMVGFTAGQAALAWALFLAVKKLLQGINELGL